MSADDARFERAAVRGNVDVPVLTYPTVRGTVRRSDPDGSHAQPFFPGLAGTSLNLRTGGDGGADVNTTVNFATNNYADAVAAVNAAAPTKFKFVESDGFFAVQGLTAGLGCFLQIMGGTAPAVLGLAVYPAPGARSQSGDIAAAPPSRGHNNPQTTGLLAHDESLSSRVINRAMLTLSLGPERKLWDLDREVPVYKVFTGVQYHPGGAIASNIVRITDPAANTERVFNDALLASIAARGDASQACALLTNDPIPQAYYDAAGALNRVVHIAYGASMAAVVVATIPWGAPTGSQYSLAGDLAFQSPKGGSTPTAITSIDGGVVYCSGATFVTWGVQENDNVIIASATNDVPFSHNGNFVVVQVIDEKRLAVRAMGEHEVTSTILSNKPPGLNSNPSGSLGNLTVVTGRNPPVAGPSGAIGDRLFIYLENNLAPGTLVKVMIPVASTIRAAMSSYSAPFLRDVSFDRDGQIAYKNQANTFIKHNAFTSGITASDTSAVAITATGGGANAGIQSTGGAGGGAGVIGTGGTTQGLGVYGIGGGGGTTSNGSTAIVGEAAGVHGEGLPGTVGTYASFGVYGLGGAAFSPSNYAGVGILGRGGSPAGTGVVGINDGLHSVATPSGWLQGCGVYGKGSFGVYGIGADVSGVGIGVVGQGLATSEGVQGTGGATGPGVKGLGGATSGHGVYGIGGTGVEDSSFGVFGQAGQDNHGVKGIGGARSGAGLAAIYPCVGVYGKGGSGNDVGGYFVGGGTNGHGAVAQALGTGSGLLANGGSTNGTGLVGSGVGTGAGVKGVGGATGPAVWIDGFALLTEYANASQPATPASGKAIIYLTENGVAAPNTRQQLVVKFKDGTSVVIAESELY